MPTFYIIVHIFTCSNGNTAILDEIAQVCNVSISRDCKVSCINVAMSTVILAMMPSQVTQCKKDICENLFMLNLENG